MPIKQGRPTQVGLWAADQFFLIIWATIYQNTDFSLNSESSLGRTKIFLGRRLDAPAIEDIFRMISTK
jgi:hypothetical protein